MNRKAIGVFDSGLGGLSAVRQLIRLAPTEDIVFFGDTARVPYGTRTAETITRYSLEDISFLLSQDVKLIIAACGTVSSTFPRALSDRIPVPYVNVLGATARAAVRATRNGCIGILGTEATIKSGSFAREVAELRPDAVTIPKACPMFVPLVENGYIARDCEVTRLIAKEYLEPVIAAGADTLILGCTHYPLIKDIISDVAGSGVTLIDSGCETARAALALLEEKGLRNDCGGRHTFYTSENPDGFSALARIFLADDTVPQEVCRADLRAVPLNACFCDSTEEAHGK